MIILCFASKPGHGQFNVNIPLYSNEFRRICQYIIPAFLQKIPKKCWKALQAYLYAQKAWAVKRKGGKNGKHIYSAYRPCGRRKREFPG
jgi:hypothetical protein